MQWCIKYEGSESPGLLRGVCDLMVLIDVSVLAHHACADVEAGSTQTPAN